MGDELHCRRTRGTTRRVLCGLGALVPLALPALAQPTPVRPRLPPGRDPGPSAIPFAIVDSGIDYRDAAIAQRLARDGEGGLVGWDDEAGDALPFDRPFPDGTGPALGTALARIALAEAGASKLIAVRRHPTDPLGVARSISFAAQTAARVVLVGHIPPAPRAWAACREAAAHYPRLLVVAWTGGPGGVPVPGARDLANVLVAAAADPHGRPLAPADPALADAFIPVDSAIQPETAVTVPAGATAGARATALAVRLLAVAPELRGGALKVRILTHALPLPAGQGVWLPRARRLFWLE